MANLKWCPNCNQFVSPQRKSMGNRGGLFLGMLLIGIILLFFQWILGAIILVFAGVFFLVGLLFEIKTVAERRHCPICKANNLLDKKPQNIGDARASSSRWSP